MSDLGQRLDAALGRPLSLYLRIRHDEDESPCALLLWNREHLMPGPGWIVRMPQGYRAGVVSISGPEREANEGGIPYDVVDMVVTGPRPGR